MDWNDAHVLVAGVGTGRVTGWELEAFYRLPETEQGFTSRVVRTDFAFASNERAAETMGYFFGQEVAQGVRARGPAIIPEFAGIWWKRVAG